MWRVGVGTLKPWLSLRMTVVTLARSADVLSIVQSAAQAVLQSGCPCCCPPRRSRPGHSLLSCPAQFQAMK
ncbi:hypothetical protein CR201_G0055204 [Pongo abelii]|uniref:Secreted protein n=1 Tax=Pongo abelii TaxID=9601 RepID=A0A2J8R0G7_PONAB|nr:hypothetical protein CR201_G0055204 [Pongo abelii]